MRWVNFSSLIFLQIIYAHEFLSISYTFLGILYCYLTVFSVLHICIFWSSHWKKKLSIFFLKIVFLCVVSEHLWSVSSKIGIRFTTERMSKHAFLVSGHELGVYKTCVFFFFSCSCFLPSPQFSATLRLFGAFYLLFLALFITFLIYHWKLKLTSKNKQQVCAQSVNKNNNAEIKWHRDFCWWSGNSIKRKTTPGQQNPGYPLFRRQS